MGAGDGTDDGQAQASAEIAFDVEEALEDFFLRIVRNSIALIGNMDFGHRCLSGKANGYGAVTAVRNRVVDQVMQGDSDQRGISMDAHRVRRRIQLNRHCNGISGHHGGHEIAKVDGLFVGRQRLLLKPVLHYEIVGQIGEANGGNADVVESPGDFGRNLAGDDVQ